MAHPTLAATYRSRALLPTTGPLASYLLSLISIKQTNLCLSADVETSAELLQLAEECGDSICLLKTHCDIVTDWTDRTAQALREIARRKYFLIFEDRKFADIGETVKKQYTSGHHRIASWADITNAHVLPGPAIVTALHQAADATIAKYNTAVHTEISASPRTQQPNGAYDSEDEYDSDDAEHEHDAQNANQLPTPALESPMDIDPASEGRRLSIKPTDRKHSVVSVSTTISMRTESISPRPSDATYTNVPHTSNLTSNPFASSALDEESFSASTTDKSAELARLGEPPFLRSLLLLAEMSSEGHLMDATYRAATLAIARSNRDFVLGFIAQRSLNSAPEDNFITMTPGCQLPPADQPQQGEGEGGKLGDALGQQYNTPLKLVKQQGCDVVIVGRGIVRQKVGERRGEAERYRVEGWRAYEERIGRVR